LSITGGALTFSLFASDKTNIIEVYPHNKVFDKIYYITIYDILKLKYKLFMDLELLYTSTPGNDANLKINMNSFINFINLEY
jgi:hypothetical protein